MNNIMRCTCARRRIIQAAVRGGGGGEGSTDPWFHYKRCQLSQFDSIFSTREGGFHHLTYLYAMLLRQMHVLVRVCYGVPRVELKKDMQWLPSAEQMHMQAIMGSAGGAGEAKAVMQSLGQLFGGQFGGNVVFGGAAAASVRGVAPGVQQDPSALILLATAANEKCPCEKPFEPVTYGQQKGRGSKQREDAAAAESTAAASTSAAASVAAAGLASSPVKREQSSAAAAASSPPPRKQADFLANRTADNTVDLLDSEEDEDATAKGEGKGDVSAAVAAASEPRRSPARDTLNALAADGAAAAAAAAVHTESDADSAAQTKRKTRSKAAATPAVVSSKSKSAPSSASAAAAPAAAGLTRGRAAAAKARGNYAERDGSSSEDDGGEEEEAELETESEQDKGDDDDDEVMEVTPTKKGRKAPASKKKSAAATSSAAATPRKRKASAGGKSKSASSALDAASVSDNESLPPPSAASTKKAPRMSKAMRAATDAVRRAAAEELDFSDGMEEAEQARRAASAPSAAAAASAGSRKSAAASSSDKLPKKQYFEHGWPLVWCEFYSPEDRRWIHVDVLRSLFDSPGVYEHDGGLHLSYVFAVRPSVPGARPLVTDVTRRYTRKWAAVLAGRGPLANEEAWVAQHLSQASGPCAAADRHIEQRDAAELLALHSAARAALPERLSELKNHPLFVCKAHLKKFEEIYPDGPEHAVGSVLEKKRAMKKDKDADDEEDPQPASAGPVVTHLVYPRSHLHVLHTVDRWRKEQRAVRDEELAFPRKVVKKNMMLSARQREERKRLGLLSAEAEQSKLYGIWQTVPWMAEAAANGIVPKNERGQVDLWDRDPRFLPPGCVHLNYPRMEVLCKKLGVDCARAFTGFDIKQGRTVPRFEGVIICAEFEADVLAAWHAAENRARERAEKKRLDAIIANWKHVVRGTLVAAKLRASLGAKEGRSVLGADGQPVIAAAASSTAAGAAGGGAAAATPGGAAGIADTPYGSIALAGAALQKPGGGGADATAPGAPHKHAFTQQRFDETASAWIRFCACGVSEAAEEF